MEASRRAATPPVAPCCCAGADGTSTCPSAIRAATHDASARTPSGASRTGRPPTVSGAGRGTRSVQERGRSIKRPSRPTAASASGPCRLTTSTGSPHHGCTGMRIVVDSTPEEGFRVDFVVVRLVLRMASVGVDLLARRLVRGYRVHPHVHRAADGELDVLLGPEGLGDAIAYLWVVLVEDDLVPRGVPDPAREFLRHLLEVREGLVRKQQRDVRVPQLVDRVREPLVRERVELVGVDVKRELAPRPVELPQGTDLLHVLQHTQADVPRQLLVVVRRQEEPDDARTVDLVLEHDVGVVGVDRGDVVARDRSQEAGEGLADLAAELPDLGLDAAPCLPVRALPEAAGEDVAAGDRGGD